MTTPASTDAHLVVLDDVRTHFGGRRGLLGRDRPAVRAVDGVSLRIAPGERVGLVGESGSGKTTLARTLLGLTPATSGGVHVDGVDVRRARRGARQRLRRTAQMVFQDPHASLSPRLTVEALLTEPYRIHRVPGPDRAGAESLLDMVGLRPELAGQYPHELSGGQARRVNIARALALRPKLLVADEPTAGLDVSAAASVLNLFGDLTGELGLATLMVTHNLNTVAYAVDRVAVMYLGQVVECGPVDTVFENPAHPYTRALLAAVPEPDPDARRDEEPLAGEVPSPRTPPPGCRFHPRCPLATDRCRVDRPESREVAGRDVACHHAETVLETQHA